MHWVLLIDHAMSSAGAPDISSPSASLSLSLSSLLLSLTFGPSTTSVEQTTALC